MKKTLVEINREISTNFPFFQHEQCIHKYSLRFGELCNFVDLLRENYEKSNKSDIRKKKHQRKLVEWLIASEQPNKVVVYLDFGISYAMKKRINFFKHHNIPVDFRFSHQWNPKCS